MRAFARTSVLTLLLTGSVALTCSAQTGVALRVGTLGPGIEVSRRLAPVVSARAQFSYLPRTHVPEYTLNRTDMDVAFDGHATLRSWALFVDLHPPIGPIRVTAGVVGIGSLIEGRGRPLQDYEYEGTVYTPEEMGTVTSEISWKSRVRPYLGLGTGSPPASRGVGFQFDLGVVFSGSPEFEMTSATPFIPTPAQLERAEEIVRWAKIYPVLSVGVSFGI
jgi:hypothetical protein